MKKCLSLIGIPKMIQNLEFWQSRRLKFEEAKPASKQRLCKHRCNADGFKVEDTGAAKSQILNHFRYITVFICLVLLTSCGKNTSNYWQEPQSSTTDLSDSRALWKSDEALTKREIMASLEEDFIPLEEEDLKSQFADGAIPQPKDEPGTPGSKIPTIDKFYKPTAYLATIFNNVYFNTDDHILRGKDSLALVEKMAEYLKDHKNLYLCIEGHCDERGPEAYNLSLGSRRANYVRTLLVQKGVDLNQIHTISYGKERPTDLGHSAQAWMKNRRAEFKLFEIQ